MNKFNKLKFTFSLFLVNNFFKGTRFFNIKRHLLSNAGIIIGKDTKVVGPIYIGTVAKLEIGNNCWINKNFSIEGNGKVQIGNNCDFAPDISFLTGSHEIGDSHRRAGKGVTWNYKVGDGTWIGAKVTILNGIEIGEGVIIGAASLVNSRCNDNHMYVGTPAHQKKMLD